MQIDPDAGAHLDAATAIGHGDGLGHLDFLAVADALLAAHALGGVVFQGEALGGVVGFPGGGGHIGEAGLVRLVLVAVILQEAVAILVAGQAVHAMLAQEQFQGVLPGGADALGLGADLHPLGHRAGAGGLEAPLTLDQSNNISRGDAERKREKRVNSISIFFFLLPLSFPSASLRETVPSVFENPSGEIP